MITAPEIPEDARRTLAEIEKHPKVAAAMLFGSWARGETTALSDIDIAVIMKDADRDEEAEIGSLYSPKVDVAVFHRLPLYMQFEVLRTGTELFVKDEGVLAQVREDVLRRRQDVSRLPGIDCRGTAVRFEENILRFERHWQKARELCDSDLSDYFVQTALAMECFQAVDALIEMGEHLIARRKLGFPSSYREIFDLLHQQGELSEEAVKAARRLVYLRNLIAHEYYWITPQELREATELLNLMEEFANTAKEKGRREEGA